MRYAWIFLLFLITPVFAGDAHQGCPYHDQHMKSALEERGEAVMGFSQEKASHHFLLAENGGIISVEANDSRDADTISAIQMHLNMVAKSFGNGDFQMAHAIHLQDPPGTETMRLLKEEIRYNLERTEKGAKVKIVTDNAEAIAAIHDFLKFQIQEHHTGDDTGSSTK
jgi:hypothetical protein